MLKQKVGRVEVHIEATCKAAVKIDELLEISQDEVNSVIKECCEKSPDGDRRYVIECDCHERLGSLLYLIESVTGAAVEECHIV